MLTKGRQVVLIDPAFDSRAALERTRMPQAFRRRNVPFATAGLDMREAKVSGAPVMPEMLEPVGANVDGKESVAPAKARELEYEMQLRSGNPALPGVIITKPNPAALHIIVVLKIAFHLIVPPGVAMG